MDDPRWLPTTHEDRYHGRVDTRDGRSLWVLRRLHLASGWFVETRLDAPDGPLIDRRSVTTSGAGYRLIETRRLAIARQGAAEVLASELAIDEPQPDLGIVVAHGPTNQRGLPRPASIDGDEGRPVCRVAFLLAGPHDVTYPGWPRAQSTVAVTPGSVTHAHTPWFGFWWRPERSLPPWHRCRATTLRFEDGLVTAKGDVRTAAGSL